RAARAGGAAGNEDPPAENRAPRRPGAARRRRSLLRGGRGGHRDPDPQCQRTAAPRPPRADRPAAAQHLRLGAARVTPAEDRGSSGGGPSDPGEGRLVDYLAELRADPPPTD